VPSAARETCYQEQECIDCTDVVKNGDETDVDCGGGTCPACDLGKSCNVSADCATTQCLAGVLDPAKLCCNLAGCGGPCGACDLPYAKGSCQPMPSSFAGLPACGAGQLCNGGGSYVSDNGKGGLAATCNNSTQCYNSTCFAGLCKLNNIDWCEKDIECVSGRCFQNQCQACVTGADCASGSCSIGICKLPGGSPCASPAECVLGICTGGYCVMPNGTGCGSDADCASRFCNSSNVCAPCSSNNDCPGTTCVNNIFCKAPLGTYCTADIQCESGNCSAIPTNPFKECR
jgi:hypothetical protein